MAASLLFLLGAGAPNRGRCVTAAVPWPFELPDGSVAPPGAVTLCLNHIYSPVTGLHELRAGERAVGMFTSRFGEAEDRPQARPVLVFEVTSRGRHRLLGYALPGAETVDTFRFYDPLAGKAERLAARRPLLESEDSETVLLAAAPGQR